tara:strand:+ start:48 stop:614 length:567 start_codon:yes stop_codon:yes gene_type:complete
MDLIKLNIVGYSHSEFQKGAFALILSEENRNRSLSIVIGSCEAQSIAIGLEKITVPRPLTHDLFKTFSEKFKIELKHIYIYKILNGIFHSYLFFKDAQGKEKKIDARTSDAVAIAIRFKVPIYTNEKILKETNSEKKEKKKEKKKKAKTKNYSDFSINDLKNELKKVLLLENYEEAAKIRDEISNRKK